MLLMSLLFIFLAMFMLILAFIPIKWDSRPTLNLAPDLQQGLVAPPKPENKGPFGALQKLLRKVALINAPLTIGPLGRRISRDLGMAKMAMTAEEFLLIKEIFIVVLAFMTLTFMGPQSELFLFAMIMSFGIGYFLPEFWLKGRIRAIKEAIVRELPDTVDLLGLCVNAGLDFMMALKYVIEKSAPTVIIEELRIMMQEINVGKPRRDALRDLSRKHELPDLATFSRTLIQADRMGTSVSDALNILSEDMRDARFRRGETIAMKAPLKMLIPLLLFIFPVVAILVAGPVFLDFFQNNPLQNLAR